MQAIHSPANPACWLFWIFPFVLMIFTSGCWEAGWHSYKTLGVGEQETFMLCQILRPELNKIIRMASTFSCVIAHSEWCENCHLDLTVIIIPALGRLWGRRIRKGSMPWAREMAEEKGEPPGNWTGIWDHMTEVDCTGRTPSAPTVLPCNLPEQKETGCCLPPDRKT